MTDMNSPLIRSAESTDEKLGGRPPEVLVIMVISGI
jgi:hypothetical protein